MEWFVQTYTEGLDDEPVRVLDVGSYDVNGTYRDLFPAPRFSYTGLDICEGPNVDIVLEHPYDWSTIDTESYDLVISGQAFEHTEFFWKTMEEMARVLRKDGTLCLIAPQGFAEHRYPVDCYRFFSDGMIALARYVNLVPLHAHTNCAPTPEHQDWFSDNEADSMLVARKPYSGPAQLPDFTAYQCVPVRQETARNGFISPQG
jgi:SAM-dependent methyltransferase